MHTERKPRGALWAIGGFAIAGILQLAAGIYWDDSRITIMGSAALVFAAVGGLALEALRMKKTAPVAAAPIAAANGRKIEFDYVEPQGTAPTNAAAAVWNADTPMSSPARAALGEDLIEFELADEKKSPTRLVVPSAFNLETHVDAAPLSTRREAIAAGAAVSRRKEIVSGLPLLTSILAEEPPTATLVAAPTPGKSRGQCSACGTMLWAPSQRPIRLRCPRCGHVRTLTE